LLPSFVTLGSNLFTCHAYGVLLSHAMKVKFGKAKLPKNTKRERGFRFPLSLFETPSPLKRPRGNQWFPHWILLLAQPDIGIFAYTLLKVGTLLLKCLINSLCYFSFIAACNVSLRTPNGGVSNRGGHSPLFGRFRGGDT